MVKEDFKFIQLSSLEKVFLDEEPLAAELNEASILKNERLSYQIAYTYEGKPLSDVNVFEFKVSINSPLKKYIKLRRVCNVPVELTHYAFSCDDDYLRKAPGLYPDALRELNSDTIGVAKQVWNAIWITIDTKGEFPSGVYFVDIVFEYNEVKIEKRLNVKIINAELPKQETIVCNWFHTDCLASVYNVKMYSNKHWQIIEEFMKCAIENGVNSIYTPLFSIPLDTSPGMKRPACQLVDITFSNGKYTFDFTKLRKWIYIFKKYNGSYLEMSHLFTQWGAKFTPRIVAMVNGKQKDIFGWKIPSSSPEYMNFLEACIPELIKVLKDENVSDKVLFHVSDEPHLEDLDSYTSARNVVFELIKDYKIIEACSEVETYETGAVEYPIVHLPSVDSYLEKGITPFGAYFCCSTRFDNHCNRFIDMPSYRNRVLGTILFKYNIKSLLHFGFNYYFKRGFAGGTAEVVNPFFATDAGNAIPGGNGYVVYPGENGKPVPSIRLCVTYDALQDIRAMKLLESYIGHEAIVEIIEELAKCEIRTNVYPKNAEFLLKLREKINAKIEEVAN